MLLKQESLTKSALGFSILLAVLLVWPCFAESVSVSEYSEVKITLTENLTLSDIEALTIAPGSEVELIDDGQRVLVQLAKDDVEKLISSGAQVIVVRNFRLVESVSANGRSGTSSGDAGAMSCGGAYYEDANPNNYYIYDNQQLWGSDIDFSGYPAGTVTCVDVNYVVTDLQWISLVDVELSDADPSYTYPLVSEWDGKYGDISQTSTGITAFAGKAANQVWTLWAFDRDADGWTYIDYWWIKLYYVAPSYCTATSSSCLFSEYVERVQVGDIDNTTDCNNYTDYTAQSTTMQRGSGYPVTVTNGHPYDEFDGCGIWVDWNQDLDFDDEGEEIPLSFGQTDGGGGAVTFVGTIIPPMGAALGSTRMRVRVLYGYLLYPCGPDDYGEVEDYTITVVDNPEKYGGGQGIAGNPYLIYTPEQMDLIGATPGDWAAHFQLRSDIDLAGYTGTSFNLIGTMATAFTGVFDGNNHTIDHFTYSSTATEGTALFVKLSGASSEIKDLALTTANVNGGTGAKVASLVGFLSQGTVSGCHSTGCNIFGGNDVGGLVAVNASGTISNCYTTGQVEGNQSVGGFAGTNGDTINDCYSEATVTGQESTGGFVGFQTRDGSITDCHSTGPVGTSSNSIGGFAGVLLGDVTNCYSTGNVEGNNAVGGFIGKGDDNLIARRCYSTGSVTGTDSVGGFMGSFRDGQVHNSYSIGDVTADDVAGGLVGLNKGSLIAYCYSSNVIVCAGNVGAFVGSEDGSFTGDYTNCYWDSDVSPALNGIGNSTHSDVTAKTTTQMCTQSTFTGWDFSTAVWDICEAQNYPKLAWQQRILCDFVCPDGVEFHDFAFLAARFGNTGCAASNNCDGVDFDLSGEVDWPDVKIMASRWLYGTASFY